MKPYRIKFVTLKLWRVGLLLALVGFLGCDGRPSTTSPPTRAETGTEGEINSEAPQPPGD